MNASATKERPIIFSSPMVRAILDGRKSMTRRVVKPQPPGHISDSIRYWCDTGEMFGFGKIACDELAGIVWPQQNGKSIVCPYGEPGDRLWVREAHAVRRDIDPVADLEKALHYLVYRADYGGDLADEWHDYGRWRPSIFMPRWASRITLEVTAVRVERLQAIGEADAQAEGVEFPAPWSGVGRRTHPTCIDAFRETWDALNAKRGFGWEANPWAWVVEFRRVESIGR